MKNNPSLLILALIFALIALTGCSSERDPNPENFTRAINHHLHKKKLCFVDAELKFPRTLAAGKTMKQSLVDKYEALHAAGLVSRRRTIKQVNQRDLQIKMEKATVYDLTATGYRYSRKIRQKDKTIVRRFCFARQHAAGIKAFTKPKKIGKDTITQVTFKYSITKVADWARKKKLLDQYPEVRREVQTLEKPVERQATLRLTKKRWTYARPAK